MLRDGVNNWTQPSNRPVCEQSSTTWKKIARDSVGSAVRPPEPCLGKQRMSAEALSRELLISDFDFELPEELIAQTPPSVRGSSRMLHLDRSSGRLADRQFAELPELLQPGDLLVLNNSRVIPARLFAQRTNLRDRQQATGTIEVLLAEFHSNGEWTALVRPGRKVRVGDHLVFRDASAAEGFEESRPPVLEAEVVGAGEFGERRLRFADVSGDFFAALDRIGHMPLPPYIHRSDAPDDRERYQTVYAREHGSVAAPTAGLHFTPEILAALAEREITHTFLTLHVGLGTFAPLRVERVQEIRLHREPYTLPEETAAALRSARREGRRILAVGTTVVRTLEHCAMQAQPELPTAHTGSTSIFLSPGHSFRLVDGMLTNFHLPQSSLLMLVSAFAGRERVLAAYRHAVERRYRFFSYGDCMLLT